MANNNVLLFKGSVTKGAEDHLKKGQLIYIRPTYRGEPHDPRVVAMDMYAYQNFEFTQAIADNYDVDLALRELVEDTTDENGRRVVCAILRALSSHGTD